MMNNLKRKLRVTQNQKGFTLVELLVVVGIIVALAAVIVPMTLTFAKKGQEGASVAELDTVQTAMDAAMASELVLVLDNPPTEGTFDFSGQTPAGIPGGLGAYMRKTQTTYQYCWDTNGLVTHTVPLTPAEDGVVNCVP